MTGRSLRGVCLAVTMLVAACGGSTPTSAPGATAAPGGATAGPGQSTANVTAAPQPTQGGGGSGGGVFTGDPCSLLTAAELEQVTGLKGATATLEASGCTWKLPDDIAAKTLLITGQDALTAAANAKTQAAAADVLPGIGDWAAWDPVSKGVLFIKGSTLVGVQGGPLFADVDTKKANSIALAKLIAAKL